MAARPGNEAGAKWQNICKIETVERRAGQTARSAQLVQKGRGNLNLRNKFKSLRYFYPSMIADLTRELRSKYAEKSKVQPPCTGDWRQVFQAERFV